MATKQFRSGLPARMHRQSVIALLARFGYATPRYRLYSGWRFCCSRFLGAVGHNHGQPGCIASCYGATAGVDLAGLHRRRSWPFRAVALRTVHSRCGWAGHIPDDDWPARGLSHQCDRKCGPCGICRRNCFWPGCPQHRRREQHTGMGGVAPSAPIWDLGGDSLGAGRCGAARFMRTGTLRICIVAGAQTRSRKR